MDGAGVDLISVLGESRHVFLEPPPTVNSAAIRFAKNILDSLAIDIADAQRQRRDVNRKRKRRRETENEEQILQIRKVYIDGLGIKQIWEQARRVLDATYDEIERDFKSYTSIDIQDPRSNDGFSNLERDRAVVANENLNEELGEESQDYDNALSENDSSGSEKAEIENENGVGNEIDAAEMKDDEEDISEVLSDDEMRSEKPPAQQQTFLQDPNGLNDGFFLIDDFNRQTQFLEQRDLRGEDDNPSDEDEVDWDADPLSMPIPTVVRNSKTTGVDEEDENGYESESENGPTFGNANLSVPDSDEDIEDGDTDLDHALPGLNNTNDVLYADFFEPPPKKPSKTKRMRALPKTQPPKPDTPQMQDELDADIQRAVDDVNRDIFASEEESMDDESGSDIDRLKSASMSTHEKQRAKIAAEIRKLEAANVAKRDWTLSGEARAVDRPLNSLLEEDMEFERTGKPVPVITAEVSEEIEQLIKRRIIAREFDEVIRRHPEAVGAANDTRRGRIEINDTKSQTGLAELYEQEHLKTIDPDYIDKRSAATKKQHDEIDRLWKEVSNQLDLLTNLNFKPKRADVQIKTVQDKPVISMEDARPLGAGGDDNMLAPQEIYRPGESGQVKTEVLRKSGASVDKEEMTREEKLRRRRREKERMKKAGLNKPSSTVGGNTSSVGTGKKRKDQEKQDILADLRKGNVKVIGKKGDLQDLGKQKGAPGGLGSSALKL